MLKQCRSRGGQAVLSEYTMVIFIVIAAVVAITVYVQRSLEARIHDARNFMIDTVSNDSVCDANCLMATGAISHEYEPYYTQTSASSQQSQAQTLTAAQGNAQSIGAIYNKIVHEDTQMNSISNQLPAEDAYVTQPS